VLHPLEVAVVCVFATVAFTSDVGTQLIANWVVTSKETWSKVNWDEAIIAACDGAESAAFAVVPVGTVGQVGINAVIGGT
jgi:Flp pilus assembly protein protease CpaA